MSLTVSGGITDQHKLIEQLLRMICWRARVNPNNGQVTLTDDPPPKDACNPKTGCDCLKKLIDSKRKVKIHPVTHPDKPIKVPKSPLGPEREERPDKAGGGITVGGPSGFGTADNPGSNKEGVGSDVDVYIDMTQKGGWGYDHGCDTWLILAHELTSGHASQLATGTCASTKDKAEAQAIESENTHRKEHGLPARPIPEAK